MYNSVVTKCEAMYKSVVTECEAIIKGEIDDNESYMRFSFAIRFNGIALPDFS